MIPILLPLLDDEDQNVRFQTAFALGKLGDSSGAALIRMYLTGDDTFARTNLIEPLTALKTLGLPAVPLVVDLAYDVMGMSFIEVECLDLLASILAEQNDTSAQLVLKRMLEHRVKAVRQAAQRAVHHTTGNAPPITVS